MLSLIWWHRISITLKLTEICKQTFFFPLIFREKYIYFRFKVITVGSVVQSEEFMSVTVHVFFNLNHMIRQRLFICTKNQKKSVKKKKPLLNTKRAIETAYV